MTSNQSSFGSLTNRRQNPRDGSILPCSSTSETRRNNHGIYQDNIEEESGGFEDRGEKTRYSTLQRQRKQLNGDFRDHPSSSRMRGNQVSSTFFNQKVLAVDAFLIGKSLFFV